MISSVFSLFIGLFYVIILQFSAITSASFVGCSVYFGVGNNVNNMTVVTRSRANILRTSIHEVANIPFNNNVSINEIQHSIHEQQSSPVMDTQPSTDFSSSIDLSFTGSSILLHHSSSLQVFNTRQEVHTSINVSKFQNSDISNCPCSLPADCNKLSNSIFLIMESDCEDRKEAPSSTINGHDITQLFASLSAQMTYQTICLQDKLSTDFLVVVQAHDKFKQEVRDELDELRALIAQQGSVSHSSGTINKSSVAEGSSPSSVLPIVTPNFGGLSTSSSSASPNNYSFGFGSGYSNPNVDNAYRFFLQTFLSYFGQEYRYKIGLAQVKR
jgi:hypothetical protein